MTRHWQLEGGAFCEAQSIPLSDRGFRYGMAFFETLRVERGRVFFLEEHLANLQEACAQARFRAEVAPVGPFLRGQFNPGDTGVARIHVTAGDGAPGEPVRACRVYVSYEPRGELPASYALQTSAAVHHPFASGRKTHNYWSHTAALLTAHEARFDEALLSGADGNIISAAMANVFVVDAADASILTSPLASGARAGVVRAWVCRQRPVRETPLAPEILRRASGLFLTNSWIGVMPVGKLDGRELPNQAVATELRTELNAFYDRIPVHP